MNAMDMMVMNGLDSGSEFTYESKYKGASVIDYIILEKQLVSFCGEEDKSGLDFKHSAKQDQEIRSLRRTRGDFAIGQGA